MISRIGRRSSHAVMLGAITLALLAGACADDGTTPLQTEGAQTAEEDREATTAPGGATLSEAELLDLVIQSRPQGLEARVQEDGVTADFEISDKAAFPQEDSLEGPVRVDDAGLPATVHVQVLRDDATRAGYEQSFERLGAIPTDLKSCDQCRVFLLDRSPEYLQVFIFSESYFINLRSDRPEVFAALSGWVTRINP